MSTAKECVIPLMRVCFLVYTWYTIPGILPVIQVILSVAIESIFKNKNVFHRVTYAKL